ncbi:hypothetical protein [Megasphaera sueciensis]|uniref:hypothetical protein n=1 Tax=Megasphaera sueciensis TaxID=349094 RepID=UPI003D00A47B
MEGVLVGIIGGLVAMVGVLIKFSIINPIAKWPEQVQELAKLQVSTDESVHSAHKRIDGLEERVEVLERK